MTASSVEDRLETLGETLRQRPSLVPQVVEAVRRSPSSQRATSDAETLPTASRRRRRPMIVAALAVAAAVLVAISLRPFATTSWADVVAAVGAKPWIHARSADGSAEMWLGNQPPCWAFKARDRVMYWDETQRAKYEFRTGAKSMTKYPLAAGEMDRILTIEDGGDEPRVGPWLFGTESIVAQVRRDVVEDGRNWIEFQLTLSRGAARQATLRVDPQTLLPVSLTCRVSEEKPPTSVWNFDYPEDGPKDVYALGVPRGIEIDSHLLAADVQQVLDGMAASRDKFGNFRLIVGRESTRYAWPTYVVYRKRDRWRIDTAAPGAIAVPAKFLDGQQWSQWWDEQLKAQRVFRWLVCNGRAVYRNASDPNTDEVKWGPAEPIAPASLMSADRGGGLPEWVRVAHLVYPDLTPPRGFGFEFDPHPDDAPDCVLLKLSARIATVEPMKAHEWYWIDPAKGFAVVRAERFNLPADVAPGPDRFAAGQSLRMEQFRKTPAGAWYPGLVRESAAMKPLATHGHEHPDERREGSARYLFDFETELPDSLFEVAPPK